MACRPVQCPPIDKGQRKPRHGFVYWRRATATAPPARSRSLENHWEMVNLDDPKEFFRVIVEPNLWEFYAKEEDLRLGVNSILTLDALGRGLINA